MSKTIYHRHHIIPKHMGGDNSSENLTEPITILKHAERHKELYAIFGHSEDLWAWKFLAGLPTNNIPMSEDVKRKIGLANKGKKYGPHTEEHKRKISLGNKNKIISPETKLKMKLSSISRSKPFIINNRKFQALSDATQYTGITREAIRLRLKSKNFPEYQYIK